MTGWDVGFVESAIKCFGSYFPIDQLFFDPVATVGWNFYDAERRVVIESNNPAHESMPGPVWAWCGDLRGRLGGVRRLEPRSGSVTPHIQTVNVGLREAF